VTNTIVAENVVPVKTFTLTIDLPQPFVCARCQDAVGYLFQKSGLCLSCELDDEAIRRAEQREADESGAEEAVFTCGLE
jgi:hypothetical protein